MGGLRSLSRAQSGAVALACGVVIGFLREWGRHASGVVQVVLLLISAALAAFGLMVLLVNAARRERERHESSRAPDSPPDPNNDS